MLQKLSQLFSAINLLKKKAFFSAARSQIKHCLTMSFVTGDIDWYLSHPRIAIFSRCNAFSRNSEQLCRNGFPQISFYHMLILASDFENFKE